MLPHDPARSIVSGHWWAWIPAGFALCAVTYYLLCLWSASRFLAMRRQAQKNPPQSFAPPISILKPVRGTDPQAYESFRSHCVQDYANYEIIFGVGDENDAAVPLIKRLIGEFPELRIVLAVCKKVLGTNRKVSNLVHMLSLARHEYLVINDGDIQVPQNYLKEIAAPLADPAVGLVTCLYRGVAAKSLGSRLEALGISSDFSPGVLAAGQIEGGIRFGMGATLAFTRRAVEAIGGFEAMVDYLADDYELGRRIADVGFKVVLSHATVQTFLPPYSWGEFVEHQLRWARGIRDARSWGYLGMIFTFGIPWALLTAVAAQAAGWSLWLLAMVLGLRLAVALAVGVGVLEDRQVLRDLLLIPVRDLVALGVWVASFAGHTVIWRGEKFLLERGKLRPVR